jgi:hypothetical protein
MSARLLVLCSMALLGPAGSAGAQSPAAEVTPFVGLGFGGSLADPSGRSFRLDPSFTYGVTLDIALVESWSLVALYLRQGTSLGRPGPDLDVKVERLMVGIQQAHEYGRTRFFGTGLAGATRFVPRLAGYGPDSRFTVCLGLGVKHALSKRFGLRAEARAFYTVTDSGSGLFCGQGGCLFAYRSSGLLQGDVIAGATVAF